jgi:hypothetical protein
MKLSVFIKQENSLPDVQQSPDGKGFSATGLVTWSRGEFSCSPERAV